MAGNFEKYDVVLRFVNEMGDKGVTANSVWVKTKVQNSKVILEELTELDLVKSTRLDGAAAISYYITTKGSNVVKNGSYEEYYHNKEKEESEYRQLQIKNLEATTKNAKWSIWISILSLIVAIGSIIITIFIK